MLPLQKWRFCVFVLAMTCVVLSLPAEVRESREYHGKTVTCSYGGGWFVSMMRGGRDCSTRGYARVFTGTVASAIETSETDKRLEIIPDEVFVGDPVDEVTATVNQACLPKNLPEIQSGDKWLFFLLGDHFFHTSELILPVNGPSKPLSQAQDDIATLRHLARLIDSAVLTGDVERLGETYDSRPLPVQNRRIVAKSTSGRGKYTAVTNSNGHFEFELPPDTYDVTANTEPGLRELESTFRRSSIYLGKQACFDVDFTLLTDGKLAGRVTTANGKSARFVKVTIIPVSPVRPQFAVTTDEHGHFDISGRQPGGYLVGVGLLAQIGSREWQSRVYYPGVPTRNEAKIVELGDGEWRTDIDFKLPSRPMSGRKLAH